MIGSSTPLISTKSKNRLNRRFSQFPNPHKAFQAFHTRIAHRKYTAKTAVSHTKCNMKCNTQNKPDTLCPVMSATS